MAGSACLENFLRRFAFTATPRHLVTYLLVHCLFSISFLVFLNSSLSFVITDRLGIHHGVGDAVGTLGFVDELVALVGCPVWGVLSDRAGVRNVAAVGFALVGLGLWSVIASRNIVPGLLVARVLFAIGGSAT
jgi:MFS family permease